MRHLTLAEVIALHSRIIEATGGSAGIRDLAALQSAVAQPRMTFAGADLYPTLELKAAALAYSLINNHPFLDGNKRIGHAAMEAFLLFNGHELTATINEAEAVIMGVATGSIHREQLAKWVLDRLQPSSSD